MIHELNAIEWSGKTGDPVYLRFSEARVARTESYANGEINVDFDDNNDVIGIEMLSTDPEEWEVTARIGRAHNLGFDLLLAGAKKPSGAA